MRPSAILFSRYRAFSEEVRLDLKPLTLIVGRNGSGKSVLTRLPLLLSSGLSAYADAPLDLEAGGVTHASRYEDLIYQRSAQPFMLGAELIDGSRIVRFRSTLRHVVERHSLAIETFTLKEPGFEISLTIESPDEFTSTHPRYIVARHGDAEVTATSQVEFKGLFPHTIQGESELSARLQIAREEFQVSFGLPSYLGPFRSDSGALARIPRQGVRDLGSTGERTLDMLGDNELRGDGNLVRSVENWFGESLHGNRLKLVQNGDIPRLQVFDPLRGVDVDLSETGAGFAQLLPVVVQALARKLRIIDRPLLIVEQPELHLHPGAHGAVADLIAGAAGSVPDMSYICETHSEQFVTRVRRRIAEGEIPAAAVQIVSVGHRATEDSAAEPLRVLSIDEEGNTSGWPVGVFDEAFDDVVRIREAVNARRESATKASSA